MDTKMNWVNLPARTKHKAATPERPEAQPRPEIIWSDVVRLPGGFEVELPRLAAQKLKKMQDDAEARHAAWKAVSSKVLDQFRPEHIAAEEWLRSVHTKLPHNAPREENPSLRAAEERLARAKSDLDYNMEVQEVRASQFTAIRAPLSAVEKYLKKNYSANFVPTEPPTVSLSKGESYADAVARVRDDLKGLQSSISAIRAAPYPSALVKEKIRGVVSSLSRQGQPDVMGTIERGEGVRWPTGNVTMAETFARADDGKVLVGDPARGSVPNSLAVIAWLFEDRLRDALEQQVDKLADDAHALTPEARRQKEAECVEKILAAQYQEESIIEAAESAGQTIARREDADPRCILFVNGPAPRAR